MKKIFLATAIALISLSVFAQSWEDLIQDPEANFYDVKAAFDAEWENKEPTKGSGWKQFKRWEAFMEPRVYPSGQRLESHTYYEAWKEVKRASQDLSKDNGTWEPVGPTFWESQGWNPGLGRVNITVKHPTEDQTIFVGTPAGGLWKSEDLGLTWVPMTDNLPSIGVSGLAIDHTNPDVMYIATGDGDGGDTYSLGVLKSEDAGATWQETGLTHQLDDGVRCSKIMMDPEDNQRLWVATNDGFYYTTNGGSNWTQSISPTIRDIEINPNNSDIIYASGNRFYKSIDGGESFDQITSGVPSTSNVNRIAIAVSEADADVVYFVASDDDDNSFYGLYRSTNAGESFTQMSNSPNILSYSETGDGDGGQAWYDLAIAASPTDADQVYVGGINVWRSDNGGSTWSITSHWVHPSNVGYTHADIHSLDYFGDELYCGSDGGVFLSEDAGSSWEDISEGLQISQYYRLAVSTTDPDLILTASQDNGTNLFANGADYIHLLGGDGNAAAINYNDDDIMYSAYPGGDFQKSENGGQNFSDFSSGLTENGAWVTPLEFHPTNPNILFAALENVWKNTNGTWTVLGNVPGSSTLRSLQVCPSNPDVIYTASNGAIYRSANGGDSWSGISNGLPNVAITDIEVHPENSDKVWVTFSGYDDNEKVYYSENGGDDWSNISTGIPNLPVNCISYQFGSDDGLYIGTDAGVYYKNASTFTWSDYNDGLPNVIVNQIVFQYQSTEILIATYGRGVWKNDFFDAGSLQPVANFSANPNLICAGQSVAYTNESMFASSDIEWTFEGGTPATSTESNPVVSYANPGTFFTKLKVGNENGLDSLTIENYITVIPSVGGTTPMQEDFESANDISDLPWFVESIDENPVWDLRTDVGFESEQSIWLDNFNNGLLNNDYIMSSTYDLSGLDTAFITMRVAYAKRPDSSVERLKISISTDCGESWTFKKLFTSSSGLVSANPTNTPFAPANDEEWNLLVVDNIDPDERVENLRMRLEFRSNGGNNIYVDNINIAEEVVNSLTEYAAAELGMRVFPNPAVQGSTGQMDIELDQAEQVRVVLRDALGREISALYSGIIGAGKQSIPLELSGIPAGYYFVVIESEQRNIAASPLIIE